VNVLILAAGFGTRLKPLTNKIPKPCVPFLNVPMGLYLFRYLNSLTVTQLTVNTHHLPEKIKALYKNQPFYSGPVKFSDEEGSILGSAGGLKKASSLFANTIEQTVLMMNADEIFFGADPLFLAKAYEQHLRLNSLATLVVMKHPDAGKKFGAIWCNGPTVKDIGKSSAESETVPYHYVGMIFLDKKLLDLIPEQKESNIFYDLLKFHLKEGHVHTYEISCEWFETGNPQDYLAANETILNNLDADTLNFINKVDPSSVKMNPSGISLVSNSVNTSGLALTGFNIISKTTNPEFLKTPGSIHDSILFENEIVNENYFKA
jgi:mannose-1-phosphate guanylyltransferase